APPHGSVQLRQHGLGWMRPLRESADENHDSIHQQKDSDEEQNRNDVMFLAHELLPENNLQDHQQHQGRHSPHNRTMPNTGVFLLRQWRQAIDQTYEFLVRLGPSN